MENWQSSRLRKKLPELIKLVQCSRMLLMRLESDGILSAEEADEIDALGLNHKKVRVLCEILVGRKGAYEALLDALNKEVQSGAHAVLSKASAKCHTDGDDSFEMDTLNPIIRFANLPEFHFDHQTLIVGTLDSDLSVKRLQQAFGPDVVVNVDQAHLIKRSAFTSDDIVILVCHKQKLDHCLKSLSGKSGSRPSPKSIIVTEQSTLKIGKSFTKRGSVAVVQDELRWSDILEESQETILQQEVNFQGVPLRLSNLTDGVPLEIFDKHLSGQFLVDLIRSKCPKIVNNTVPDELRYYIPRKIQSRQRVSPTIFEATFTDVLVFVNVERHQLTKFANGRETDVTGNLGDQLTAQFILLECPDDFPRICKMSKQPVHLIRCEQEGLLWMETSGSLKLIQEHVLDDENVMMDEAAFMEACLGAGGPVCVFDSPGMGKSVLLQRMCQMIMKKFPERLVRFLVLSEFVQKLGIRKPEAISSQMVCKAIAESCSAQEFGREVVKYLLTDKNTQCELIFDGFDEVLPAHIDVARKIFQIIRALPNTRLYVSTRPHMRQDLESTLSVLGYNLVPFEDNDQVNFLVQYWTTAGEVTASTRLEEFAKNCLQKLKTNTTEFERDITGIPLQCSLLAQVHLESARRLSRSSDFQSFRNDTEISSVFEMYQKYVEMGLEKGSRCFSLNSSWRQKILQSFLPQGFTHKETLLSEHMYHALELLFPEWAVKFKFLQIHKGKSNQPQNYYICVPGILETKGFDSRLRFVHRTFAEYFVALLAFKFLTTPTYFSGNSFPNFIFNAIFSTRKTNPAHQILLGSGRFAGTSSSNVKGYEFQNLVVCHFLNALLKAWKQSLEPEAGVAGLFKIKTKQVPSSSTFHKMCTAAVVHDHAAILELLCRLDRRLKLSTELLTDLTLLGSNYSGKETLRCLKSIAGENGNTLDNLQKLHPIMDDAKFLLTPLHIAVLKGRYEIVEFFISFYSPSPQDDIGDTYVSVDLHRPRYFLHVCTADSASESDKVISDKCQIIKMLIHHGYSLEETLGSDKSTPVLQHNVHINLIKCLHEEGANFSVTTANNENVLHRAVNKVRHDMAKSLQASYHELITYLDEDTDFRRFGDKDYDGKSPLHAVLEATDLWISTLDIFVRRGVNVGARDASGEPPVVYAIRFGRSRELIERLADLTERFETLQTADGETMLHIAARHGNVRLVTRILERVETFEVDNAGNNALHAALFRRTPAHVEIQQTLIKAGANVAETNEEGHNPLIYGLARGKGVTLAVIKGMEHRGLKVDAEMAAEGAQNLLTNRNIAGSDWDDDEMVKVLQYLVYRGGGFQFKGAPSPWDLQQVKLNRDKITESIEVSSKLLERLVRFGCFSQEVKDELFKDGTPQKLINTLQEKVGTFERLIAALLFCKQEKPFTIMRQSLPAHSKPHATFLQAPKAVSDFITSEAHQILILRSDNVALTLERIRDTVSDTYDTIFITDREFFADITGLSRESLIVVTLAKVENMGGVVSQFSAHYSETKLKLVCILEQVVNMETKGKGPEGALEIRDEIQWTDFGFLYQSSLIKFLDDYFPRSGDGAVSFSHRRLLVLMSMAGKDLPHSSYISNCSEVPKRLF